MHEREGVLVDVDCWCTISFTFEATWKLIFVCGDVCKLQKTQSNTDG